MLRMLNGKPTGDDWGVRLVESRDGGNGESEGHGEHNR